MSQNTRANQILLEEDKIRAMKKMEIDIRFAKRNLETYLNSVSNILELLEDTRKNLERNNNSQTKFYITRLENLIRLMEQAGDESPLNGDDFSRLMLDLSELQVLEFKEKNP